MNLPSRKFWTMALTVLAIFGLLMGLLVPITNLNKAQAAEQKQGTTPPDIHGPFTSQPVYPTVFTGDLRDLQTTTSSGGGEVPTPGKVIQGEKTSTSPWVDPVAQQSFAHGQMPPPIIDFDGLNIADGGGWHPPDTNGDVGPVHYIQTVNIAIGIYDKATGDELLNLPYNTFFQNAPSPCNNQNRGDVIVLYDPLVDRWLVTDFSLPPGPADYECIAVSMNGDATLLDGGWYFYALQTNNPAGSWNDYPKLGVWGDGWYMTANMFDPWSGVRIWALDRASMIAGDPFIPILYDCGSCASLLPANFRGSPPPEGSPEYLASLNFPNSLYLFEFHADWVNPGNSSFTWTADIPVAPFQMASAIPQKGTDQTVDSLADRLMMQLQYRQLSDGTEVLYVNHSVSSGGVVGVRWYEVHDPGGNPMLFQQGTYQPDNNYRWMGSMSADQDGNIAVGYSVSSTALFPSIRYAGRLAGETSGILTQNEASLIEGTGSQIGSNRWGDYSAITVDPVDDCTFWYTQEYFKVTSGNWETRIGSFRFPSCGQLKGTIAGYVYNSVTNQPIAGVPVFAAGSSYNFSSQTDANGYFSIKLIAGSYDLTAGPLLPGYPGTDMINGVPVVVDETTGQDLYLDPVPSLVHDGITLADPSGNNNGYAEPGEQSLQLSESLINLGATTSTQITTKVTSLTTGVSVGKADSTYTDIAAGESGSNITPYVFSIDSSVACGTDLNFQAVISDSFSTYNTTFSLNASVPMPRQDIFFNDVEGGAAGWTIGGYPYSWAITSNQSHSPTHSWTDSPSGNYQNNANNWVQTPAYDLSDKSHIQVSGWFKYALEPGWDYAYLEYSFNGGGNWITANPLATFNGLQTDWQYITVDASALDNQANVTLRIRLVSDTGLTYDGIYVDDMALSYEPYECTYTPAPDVPVLVSPADGSWTGNPVTFVWQPADGGSPVEGYILYLDDTPMVTTTETTTTLALTSWEHIWYVVATNASGSSLPSEPWGFEVFGQFFLPLTQK
jgi:Carboxypeptidase regulatory-like domain